MKRAGGRWAACMKAWGYPFPRTSSRQGRAWNPDARPCPARGSKEIALAVADARAPNDSGVVTAWYQLEVRHQKKVKPATGGSGRDPRAVPHTHGDTRKVLRAHGARAGQP